MLLSGFEQCGLAMDGFDGGVDGASLSISAR
jgi:hypothetical protein